MKKYARVDPVRSGPKDPRQKNNFKKKYFSPASNGVDEYIADAPKDLQSSILESMQFFNQSVISLKKNLRVTR